MSSRPLAPFVTWILTITACQVPYGPDRHDLVSDRIAAIQADPPGGFAGDRVRAAALIAQEGRLWGEVAPRFAWGWVDSTDPEVAEDFDPADAVSTSAEPDLVLPDGPVARLALAVTFPSGETHRGFLDLPVGERREGLTLGDLRVQRVEGLSVDGLASGDNPATDLDLEARRDRDATDAPVAPGDVARLSVVASEGARVRWMSTAGPAGTFFELDRQTTDWAAGEIVRDDEDIETATPIASGPQSFVALALDDAGGTSWLVKDVAIGELDPQLQLDGRFLGPSGGLTGRVRGTLVADDTLPGGLRLDAPEPAPVDATPGTDGLACAPAGAAFHPSWLTTGRCGRAELVGRVVVVEVAR